MPTPTYIPPKGPGLRYVRVDSLHTCDIRPCRAQARFDARLRPGTSWGYVCPTHAREFQVRLGMGHGAVPPAPWGRPSSMGPRLRAGGPIQGVPLGAGGPYRGVWEGGYASIRAGPYCYLTPQRGMGMGPRPGAYMGVGL